MKPGLTEEIAKQSADHYEERRQLKLLQIADYQKNVEREEKRVKDQVHKSQTYTRPRSSMKTSL